MNGYTNIEKRLLINIEEICSSKEPFDVLYYFALIERLLVELLDLEHHHPTDSFQPYKNIIHLDLSLYLNLIDHHLGLYYVQSCLQME